VAYSVVRTMVAAALADGDLAPAEKAMIQDHVADSGLADDQVQQIRRDLLRRGVGDVAQREDDGEDADDEGEGVDLH